jgi:hypothetical protein
VAFLYIYGKQNTMSKIGDLLRRIGSWIKNLMDGMPEDIKEFAGIALQVTTKLKQLVDSGAVVTITELTATIKDDAIRATVSACLEGLNEWLTSLAHAKPKVRNAMLIKLASEITRCLDNSELDEHMYDVAVQNVYSAQKVA